jgi:hypothetical protein
MGGAHSRRKGRRGELEVLSRLNAIGGDGVLNYGQEELSGANGDVQTRYGNVEVKRRAAFPSWLLLHENVRAVYARKDRGPWLVVIRADDFEQLVHFRAMALGSAGVPVEPPA